MGFCSRLLGMAFLLLSTPLAAAPSVRLPLPVDSPAQAVAFEIPAPTGTVLSGFLLPAAGPLNAWAPVWSTLQADGALKETQTGGWMGPRPDRWLKVVKEGFVPTGFRFLVRVGPSGVQTRQAQIFWKPWTDGSPQGTAVTSRVYGAPAGPQDEVRIVELTLPGAAVPTGLYGETVAGTVVQLSLLVKTAPAPAAAPPKASSTTAPPEVPTGPGLTAPTRSGPQEPTVPPVVLAKP